MRSILVTGGTVFVSRYIAEYFSKKGNRVFVLNRNTRPQPEDVTLIEGDRHALGDTLRGYRFDIVLDVTAYTAQDVAQLVDALEFIGQYVLISSGAVYPETLPIPFKETDVCGPNVFWDAYGTNKLEAENVLRERVPQAYIIRPPYLYGPMQNLYREPFVFDCAEQKRPFYLPQDGSLPLQFFHVEDLCRFIEILLDKQPENRIYNVGNPETVSALEWVRLCYETVGAPLHTVSLGTEYPIRNYFCFRDYAYRLDVSRQTALMPDVKPFAEGLRESYRWYRQHKESVLRKPYMEFIDRIKSTL